ncbi:hypothetical protein [Marinobacter sp. MDS2]|uniref:hypothetical protein n=1 Tax=Marinobacter sp. MDS2 TaxID=3065961 RepID=UPI00273C58E2|nr:hypothetical protein [Marinobacter sp. MDS2]MDP4546506.1 hypothetical protein [Marinobacter sp. MDS2]
MNEIVINSEPSLRKALRDVEAEYREHKFLRLRTKAGVGRSLDQNAISHAWYNDIALQIADTPENVKCECKLRFGVPILRAEDPDFREMYDNSILRNLTYEQKLKAMRYMPVTSNMTKPQLSRYLQHVQASYAQQGVMVFFPQEMEAA